jgi:hypothetical protein
LQSVLVVMENAPELAEWGFIPAGKEEVAVRQEPLPWALFAVALLAGAVTGAAGAAIWTSVPHLADTPTIELAGSDESSEIWNETADRQALTQARAALLAPRDDDPRK